MLCVDGFPEIAGEYRAGRGSEPGVTLGSALGLLFLPHCSRNRLLSAMLYNGMVSYRRLTCAIRSERSLGSSWVSRHSLILTPARAITRIDPVIVL